MQRVATACGAPERASPLIDRLRARLAAIEHAVAGAPRRRIACLEWLDPLMTAGNWGPELVRIAQRHGRTVSQIVFRFALDVGMIPLTGTTDAGHMGADLDVFDFSLDPEEVERIERFGS